MSASITMLRQGIRAERNLTTHLKRKMRTLVQRLEREGLA